jgi:hypothetical protein
VSEAHIVMFGHVALLLAAIVNFVATMRVSKQATAIHILTNSNLTMVKANLEAANIEIGVLREQVSTLTDERPHD